ncbi:ADP-ribosylglycohydrolase family protein, partial [Streptomyces mirabilis]
ADNMARHPHTTAAVAAALAGAPRPAPAIPADWAAAIGPARGSCLPSMAGHHVLDVAELLTTGDDGKWGTGSTAPPPPDPYALTSDYILAYDDDEVQP